MRLNGVLNEDDRFEWKRGPPTGSPLPQQVTEYFNTIVFPYFFKIFDQEENKEVIEKVLENLRDLSDDFGPAIFE